MRQHNRETVTLVTPRAGRRWVWALLLMGVVASALSGCVVVPVPAGGYAYGPRPYYGRSYYYHHYYDRDRYYYDRG